VGGERRGKRLLEGKPGGRRKKGRTRLTWVDSVELDLNMDIKRWRTELCTDWEWASVVTEAKAKLRGCSAKEEEIKKFCSPHHPCPYQDNMHPHMQ
jgi:hypothetical protein